MNDMARDTLVSVARSTASVFARGQCEGLARAFPKACLTGGLLDEELWKTMYRIPRRICKGDNERDPWENGRDWIRGG